MSELLVPVIYGSVRPHRVGIRAAYFVCGQLMVRGINAVMIDPMEHQLPLLDKQYNEYEPGKAPERLEKLADLYRKADGFVVVSGEYNHNVPPALANILDYFLEEYYHRPAGIVTYSGGRFSGTRAGYALRNMLAEMGMVTIPTMYQIGNVAKTFDAQGVPQDTNQEEFSKQFFDEFVWYMNALKTARAGGVPY